MDIDKRNYIKHLTDSIYELYAVIPHEDVEERKKIAELQGIELKYRDLVYYDLCSIDISDIKSICTIGKYCEVYTKYVCIQVITDYNLLKKAWIESKTNKEI